MIFHQMETRDDKIVVKIIIVMQQPQDGLESWIVCPPFGNYKNFSHFRDHYLSSDFKELKTIVDSIRKLEIQLGKENKEIQKPEKKLIKIVRRGIYAKKDIQIKEKLSFLNTNFLRPAFSTNFLNLKKILGKRVKTKFFKDKKIKIDN